VLDDAARALVDAIAQSPDYVRAAMLGEPDAADRELGWWDTFAVATVMHARLSLRLGREHPVAVRYDAALDVLRETASDVQALRLAGDRHTDIDQRGRRGAQAIGPAFAAFVDAGLALARTSDA
jgi:hypothetical protein